jgi:4'-phosphopantetheinyl transferase
MDGEAASSTGPTGSSGAALTGLGRRKAPPATAAARHGTSSPRYWSSASCPVDAMTVDVVVAWTRHAERDASNERLVTEVVGELIGPVAAVRLTHLCPRCGSDRHGRPSLVGRPDLGISIAHSEDVTVVAGVRDTSIGVDVEPAAAATFSPVGSVLLHAAEHADSVEDLARTWVRKESLLKALGTGLTVDPRTVRISDPSQWPRPRQLPAPFEHAELQMHDLSLGTSHVGCVTVCSAVPPVVRLVEVAPAGPAR